MKITLTRLGFVALCIGVLAGCDGGGGAAVAPQPPGPPPPPPLAGAIATAAADPANDSATNPSAGFTVLQSAGKPVVTVASAPKVNFTVFSDGAVMKNLVPGNNARFIIAKLVRGTGGEADKWQSYTYRKRTGTAVTDAVQHYFVQDGGPGSGTGDYSTSANLVYNPDGYYTFTYPIDITDGNPANLPPGVTFDKNAVHRVAIQLRYTNAAGEDVRANPYFDFTFDANGNAVPVTNSSDTRKVVDINTCNQCHNRLAIHGGGRVDTQLCVLCHNPSTQDHETGNIVDFKIMVHKIHAGRHLHHLGETYKVEDADFSEVGFPANVRNCAKCHDNTSGQAPQADNWKSMPTKEACITCHTQANWSKRHITELGIFATVPADSSACASCHGATQAWSPEKVHFLQELENTKLYQNRIVSLSLTNAPTATTDGELTATVAVVNPTTGAAYDLREGCGGLSGTRTTTDSAGTTIPRCYDSYRWYTSALSATNQPQNKFGVFQVYLSTNTFQQTTDDTTDISPNLHAYRGVVDANKLYTVKLTVPKGATGNARVVMVGSVAERRVSQNPSNLPGAVPPTTHEDLAYVPVKNAISEINLSTAPVGGVAPPSNIARRKIVSNDKCNACHAYLGIPMDPVNGAHAFHSGVRNNSENCEVCHNWSRAGTYTVMTDGTDFNESFEATRLIHGIHGGSKRTYPYQHGNDLIGVFDKQGKRIEPNDGAPLQSQSGQASEVLNFAAHVAFPGRLADCNTCHVNEAWKQNLAVLGNAIVGTSTNVRNGRFINPGINQLLASGACVNPTGSIATLDLQCGSIDPLKIPVISPKAAVCSACHDSHGVRTHMINVGGAIFGGWGPTIAKNQGDVLAGRVFEACDGCHAPGAFKGIDVAHGLK